MALPFSAKSQDSLLDGVSTPGERAIRFTLPALLAIAAVSVAARLAVPIPGTPVPVTLQDLAVFAAALVLGPSRGAAAMAGYVALGAMGAPVFSNGHGGLAWLMGPTGGYLLAYPACAWLAGTGAKLHRDGRGVLALVAGVLLAEATLFAGGALQLALLTGQGWAATFAMSIAPFAVGIVVKSSLLVGFGVALARKR